MTISIKRNVVDYSFESTDAVYFWIAICGSKLKKSRQSMDFCNTRSTVGNFKSRVDD
jgi:hypothetical protein